MTTVKLTQYEMVTAAMAGVFRHAENIANGVKDTHGLNPSNGWKAHIDGALGECAFAKWMNIYWPGKGSSSDADVGEFEVRTVELEKAKNGYGLLIKKTESHKTDRAFWLVTGINNQFKVLGAIWGRDGLQDKYWRSDIRSPCWIIKKSDLIDPNEFHLEAPAIPAMGGKSIRVTHEC